MQNIFLKIISDKFDQQKFFIKLFETKKSITINFLFYMVNG